MYKINFIIFIHFFYTSFSVYFSPFPFVTPLDAFLNNKLVLSLSSFNLVKTHCEGLIGIFTGYPYIKILPFALDFDNFST